MKAHVCILKSIKTVVWSYTNWENMSLFLELFFFMSFIESIFFMQHILILVFLPELLPGPLCLPSNSDSQSSVS